MNEQHDLEADVSDGEEKRWAREVTDAVQDAFRDYQKFMVDQDRACRQIFGDATERNPLWNPIAPP